MNRRDILKYTAIFSGATISMPLLSSLMTGCKADPGGSLVATESLHFFSPEDFSLIREAIDTILPKTDSPSASEVGVHNTIDLMVGTIYEDNHKTDYQQNFDAFKGHLKATDGDMLSKFLQIETSQDISKDVKKAYLDLKQQTIAYYLTTEEIGTKFLNYLPVPGEYLPCITLEEAGGKAWAI